MLSAVELLFYKPIELRATPLLNSFLLNKTNLDLKIFGSEHKRRTNRNKQLRSQRTTIQISRQRKWISNLQQYNINRIKSTTSENTSKRKEVVLYHVRSGQTLLTHKYLFSRGTQPKYSTCNVPVIITPLFLLCLVYSSQLTTTNLPKKFFQVFYNIILHPN